MSLLTQAFQFAWEEELDVERTAPPADRWIHRSPHVSQHQLVTGNCSHEAAAAEGQLGTVPPSTG